MREVQRGSAAALEELFRREWPRAYRAAYLVVHDAAAAEDIAQEAFLAAVRAIDRFDRRRPFGPWMHRIVVNRAIDVTRARALRREVDAVAAHSAEAPPDPPSAPLPDDVVAALRRAEPGAPRRGRAALRLRLHPRRDRAGARHAARNGQLPPAPRPRPPRRGDRAMSHAVRDRLRDAAAARRGGGRRAELAGGGGGARRARPRPGRRGASPPAARLALVAALLAACLRRRCPRGRGGGRLDRRPLRARAARAAPAFAALPRGGRCSRSRRVARTRSRPDGSSRRLGAFSEAGWSPHGLHVVGVEGRRLVAVTRPGPTKWTLARRDAVHHPAWSTGDGFRGGLPRGQRR